MDLPRLHRRIGWAAVLIFIATGVYLRLHLPNLPADQAVARYLYRANHVYILLAGLINLAMGLGPGAPARRPRIRLAASSLILAAPAILLAAFIIEPSQARPQRPITQIGVVMLALGVFAAAAPRRRAPRAGDGPAR